jgi:hypothetical protein
LAVPTLSVAVLLLLTGHGHAQTVTAISAAD